MAGRSDESGVADYDGAVQYMDVSDMVLTNNSDCEVW